MAESWKKCMSNCVISTCIWKIASCGPHVTQRSCISGYQSEFPLIMCMGACCSLCSIDPVLACHASYYKESCDSVEPPDNLKDLYVAFNNLYLVQYSHQNFWQSAHPIYKLSGWLCGFPLLALVLQKTYKCIGSALHALSFDLSFALKNLGHWLGL